MTAVVARRRGRGRLRVLLVGHLDTVFASVPRLRPTPRRGGATGPGVSDDKGGLLAGIFALESARTRVGRLRISSRARRTRRSARRAHGSCSRHWPPSTTWRSAWSAPARTQPGRRPQGVADVQLESAVVPPSRRRARAWRQRRGRGRFMDLSALGGAAGRDGQRRGAAGGRASQRRPAQARLVADVRAATPASSTRWWRRSGPSRAGRRSTEQQSRCPSTLRTTVGAGRGVPSVATSPARWPPGWASTSGSPSPAGRPMPTCWPPRASRCWTVSARSEGTTTPRPVARPHQRRPPGHAAGRPPGRARRLLRPRADRRRRPRGLRILRRRAVIGPSSGPRQGRRQVRCVTCGVVRLAAGAMARCGTPSKTRSPSPTVKGTTWSRSSSTRPAAR